MTVSSKKPSAPKHALLTVLGKTPRPARYTLEGREAEAQLAPVALFDLLPEAERPEQILAVCTPEAREASWPLLEQALNGRCELRLVEINGGENQEDVAVYLEKVTGAVSDDVDLTVDVTHGFRHFSFLTYIATLYLSELRGIRVRGAYYGLLNPESSGPFLDLRPLLELPHWIHALQVLRETGSALPMAEALRDRTRNSLARDLSRLSEAYLSGLPIELGRQARSVRGNLKPLRRTLGRDHALPLSRELVDRFDETVAPFALSDPFSGDGWKRKVALSENELKRQAQIVDDLLKRGNLAAALGLMNEWVISWVVLRSGLKDEWLKFDPVRRKAAGLLGAIMAVEKDPELSKSLTDEQRSLGEFWRSLSSLRNAYHHHGMRPQPLIGERDAERSLAAICDYWHGTLRRLPDFPLALGGSSSGRILISPIGNRPGVLYSAFHACREDDGELPSLCLVICSRQTENGIAEAASRVGFTGTIERLRFEDPQGGLAELEPLTKMVRSWLIGAENVFVNVTGGTTLMGFAAEKMAEEARKLACPTVRRFGLIDRRSPAEQDADPYRVGEPFWLDRTEANDEN